jgi:hypothetical protein
MYACKFDQPEIVKLFILSGKSNCEYINDKGQSALKISRNKSKLCYNIIKHYINQVNQKYRRNKKLGSGADGCIISPPLSFQNKKFVGKISNKLDNFLNLTTEFNNYKNLPESEFFLDKNMIKLRELSNDERETAKDVCQFGYNSQNVELIMPKFTGITMEQYLKAPYKNKSKRIKITKKFSELLNETYRFYKEYGWDHGDFHGGNIIYNEKRNEMKLVDLQRSSFTIDNSDESYYESYIYGYETLKFLEVSNL